ncbi:hypothetical protein SSBR45G_65120 [Bradyrhizobium sp. SSBR45G]|nr:hypothetical protein SSBR45G_65120 [Bradyrhizobium sp. SSBR45G]GLH88230.1 hypothetical protein SSBR45R_56910 [Bradyrhizobium sp. SSBR45R]
MPGCRDSDTSVFCWACAAALQAADINMAASKPAARVAERPNFSNMGHPSSRAGSFLTAGEEMH